MSEIRAVHEIPVHIIQEFVVILRTNEKFVGEGKIKDYYLLKDEKTATIIYDNGTVSYVANFTKDPLDNWFFSSRIVVRDSLKDHISKDVIKQYFNDNEASVAKEKASE